MHRAAAFGNKAIISFLSKQDKQLIADWDENNDTPLHIAASNSRVKVARLLINLGAQVDTSNTKGWTPLHCAADVGALEIVKLLVSKGAPIEAADKSQTTPLHLACKRGHLDVVKYLISEG